MKGLPRYAARRDKSEPEIVDALKAFGFSVQRISAKDVPDLVLGKLGITRIVEVKSPGEDLTEGQSRWWGNWNGNGAIVLRTLADVERLNRLWTVLALRLR